MGEVRLDGGKLGRMGFRTRPTHQNRAIGQLLRGNYYNAVQFGYDRHEPEGYLGNVGSIRRRLEPTAFDDAQSHRIRWWTDRSTTEDYTNYTYSIYSTATNGNIVVRSNGSSIDVTYDN